MVLTTSYDDASRVRDMVYKDGSGKVSESFHYGYDSRGNRTGKTFASGGVEAYSYDKLSRLIRAAYPDGREVQYQYDAVGNRMLMIEGHSTAPGPCAGDQDCDGVPDATDNCPTVPNPSQQDSDANTSTNARPGLT